MCLNINSSFNPFQFSSPNVQYMITNYGKCSIEQFSEWVEDCGFPSTGSLSLKQLQQLKIKLLVKEERSKEDKQKGKKNVRVFVPDWGAYECWVTEAKIRDRKQKLGTDIISKSQFFRLDPDLDSALPRGRPQPLQTAQAAAPAVPHLYPDLNLVAAEEENRPPSYSTPYVAAQTPRRTQKGTHFGVNATPLAPMVEVAAGDGNTQLIYRPWTFTDMKECTLSFLPQVVNGGTRYAVQLEAFCQQFKPTSTELQRLLVTQMGIHYSKVTGVFPARDQRLVNSAWGHADNDEYRHFITDLCNQIRDSFPARMDMSKISVCKQGEDETMSDYLHRLSEVHTTNSGLTRPNLMGGTESYHPVGSPLKGPLCQWHQTGYQRDGANKLHRLGVYKPWDSWVTCHPCRKTLEQEEKENKFWVHREIADGTAGGVWNPNPRAQERWMERNRTGESWRLLQLWQNGTNGKNNDTWWDDWDAVRGKRWFPCSWTPSSSSCHRYDGMWSLGRKKLTWASKSEQKENWCSTSLMNWQSMENAWFESMKTRDPSSLVCNREIRVPQCESLQKKGFWGSPQGEHCGEHTHKQMSLLWRLTSLEGGWVFNSFSNCQEWDSASQDDFEKRCSPAKEMSHDQDGLWHIHSEHCWQYDAYRFKFLNDLLTQIPEGRN